MAQDGYYIMDFLCPTNEDWSDTWQMGTGEGEDFTPLDLTGCVFVMHVRRVAAATPAAMILSSINGRIGVSGDPDLGQVAIYVPDEEVQRLEPGEYVHDIVMINANGNPRRFATGTVTVEQGVTRI